MATFVIGVHQLFFYSDLDGLSGGILRSYGLFMLSGVFYLVYRRRVAKARLEDTPSEAPPAPKPTKRAPSKRRPPAKRKRKPHR
ncbi:MAG: hypothetical protein WBA12_00025 [Catalinimonas sp.]